MITAQEAYDLARPNIFDVYVDFINKKITDAAKNGKTEVIIRSYSNWLYGSDEKPKEVHDVLRLLKTNGFDCKLHYEEYTYPDQHFVDLGLQISWGQDD